MHNFSHENLVALVDNVRQPPYRKSKANASSAHSLSENIKEFCVVGGLSVYRRV